MGVLGELGGVPGGLESWGGGVRGVQGVLGGPGRFQGVPGVLGCLGGSRGVPGV